MVLSMEKWKGKVAVVTGASSGIGAAIATKAVEEGLYVVGLARRLEKLKEMEKKLHGNKGKFCGIKCDMSNECEIIETFKEISENIGPIHILINNAGKLFPGNLYDGETSRWTSQISVNVLGLCIATREAVSDMNKNKIDGHIININSIVGRVIPKRLQLNIYTATKHAVTAICGTLRNEMIEMKRKIKITSLNPGLVATELFEAGGMDMTSMAEMPFIKSEDVADAVIYALSTPPTVDVSELTIRPVNEDL